MAIQSFALTDIGNVRKHNEDFFVLDDNLGLYIVCDGMGGHCAGEVASRMVGESLQQLLQKDQGILQEYSTSALLDLREKIKHHLEDFVMETCQKVWDESHRVEQKKGMGTTLAMALVSGQNAFIVHIGDSRVYLIRESQLHQLTEDHSLVNELLKNGTITPDEAATHPKRNVIMRAIGMGPAVTPDILHLELKGGDQLLLCSDGLTGHLGNNEILNFLKPTLKDSVANLISEVKKRGAKDNVTALMISMGGDSSPRQKEHTGLVNKKLQTLGKIPLFSEFNFNQLSKILEILEVKIYPVGMVLITEDTVGDSMFIILQGSANVTKNGHRLNTLRPGHYFGEMALIDDAPRSATVTSLESVKCLTLERTKLFNLLKKDMDVANKIYWFFLNTLNKRLRLIEQELVKLKS